MSEINNNEMNEVKETPPPAENTETQMDDDLASELDDNYDAYLSDGGDGGDGNGDGGDGGDDGGDAGDGGDGDSDADEDEQEEDIGEPPPPPENPDAVNPTDPPEGDPTNPPEGDPTNPPEGGDGSQETDGATDGDATNGDDVIEDDKKTGEDDTLNGNDVNEEGTENGETVSENGTKNGEGKPEDSKEGQEQSEKNTEKKRGPLKQWLSNKYENIKEGIKSYINSFPSKKSLYANLGGQIALNAIAWGGKLPPDAKQQMSESLSNFCKYSDVAYEQHKYDKQLKSEFKKAYKDFEDTPPEKLNPIISEEEIQSHTYELTEEELDKYLGDTDWDVLSLSDYATSLKHPESEETSEGNDSQEDDLNPFDKNGNVQ